MGDRKVAESVGDGKGGELAGEADGEGRLARGRRPQDAYKVDISLDISPAQSLYIQDFRLGKRRHRRDTLPVRQQLRFVDKTFHRHQNDKSATKIGRFFKK